MADSVPLATVDAAAVPATALPPGASDAGRFTGWVGRIAYFAGSLLGQAVSGSAPD
jgi:hypothetical protein